MRLLLALLLILSGCAGGQRMVEPSGGSMLNAEDISSQPNLFWGWFFLVLWVGFIVFLGIYLYRSEKKSD